MRKSCCARGWRATSRIARRHVRLAAELTIIDNGPGIADELMERVFYPLISGRDDGTGLGLTLAQAFVLAE